MRYAIGVIAGLVLGAAATAALSAAPVLRLPRTDVGRFQVVNPTPTFMGRTILIDTASGESWMTCGGATNGGPVSWCKIGFGEFASAAP